MSVESDEQLERYGGERLDGDRGVLIHGWRIEWGNGPIAGSTELETLSERISARIAPSELAPLPEAVFAQNQLRLTHESSGRRLCFDAAGALTSWAHASATQGAGGLQVPVASLPAWQQKAKEMGAEGSRNFDWTYSCEYAGEALQQPSISAAAEPPDAPEKRLGKAAASGTVAGGAPLDWSTHRGAGIDMAMLRRTDVPILAFADLTLYTDDLHDCGISESRLRLRVMPGCFFILLRHWLRVDGVLARQRDTRVFHTFGASEVIRAQRVGEVPLPPVQMLGEATHPSGAPPVPYRPDWQAASIPSEQQTAEKLAVRPPTLERLEELTLHPAPSAA